MSGWLVLFGKITDLDQRLNRFKRVFSVENVPGLNVITHPVSSIQYPASFKIIFWSWREKPSSSIQYPVSSIQYPVSSIQHPVSSIQYPASSIQHPASNDFPDVYVVADSAGNALLLCGAVTDLGRYGSVSSDSEQTAKKILDLWQSYGDEIIDQINGSWSLIFYNAKDNLVTAFTDRFASRSVWFSQDGKVWIIGNFPSSIVTMRQNSTNIDPAGLWSLFFNSRHIPAKSLYKEVFALIAGQKITLMPDGRYLINWYKRRYNPDFSVKPKEWGYRLACALKASVRCYRKIMTNPYLFLSGGLDSRIVAGTFGDGLNAITLCSSINFESRVAKLVARSLGLNHQIIIRSPYWYLDTLKASALITSGNYLFVHTHFIVPTIKFATKYPDASFLLGDLLENLNKHYFSIPKGTPFTFTPERLPYLLTNFIPSVSKIHYPLSSIKHQVSSIQHSASSIQYPASSIQHSASSIQYPASSIFTGNLHQSLIDSYLSAIQDSAKLVMNVSEDDRDRFDTYLRWIDVSVTYTYNMITCIWPLASERNIFFDNDLNDLSLKIPAEIRGKGILHNWILWHLKKELLLIPDANNFLPVFIPGWVKDFSKQIRPKLGKVRRAIYRKRKKDSTVIPTAGSWPLLYELYRRDKRYRNMIESLFNDESAFPSEIFNREGIQKIWQSFLDGNFSLLFDINALITFGMLNRLIPSAGVL